MDKNSGEISWYTVEKDLDGNEYNRDEYKANRAQFLDFARKLIHFCTNIATSLGKFTKPKSEYTQYDLPFLDDSYLFHPFFADVDLDVQ